MAIFSNKIIECYFLDKEERTVIVHYEAPDNNTVNRFQIDVNYENPEFLELMEERTIEQIQDESQDFYNRQHQAVNNLILKEAQKLFEEWRKEAQTYLDKQDKERYEIFEKYKEQTLKNLYKEVDVYANKKYKEVDVYADQEKKKKLKELYREMDTYAEREKAKKLDEIQLEVDKRYDEIDNYQGTQIEILKKELKDQFAVPVTENSRLSTENVVKYILENEQDEDFLFKLKLSVFNKPNVKNNNNRDLKMKVRKAKDIKELFAAYNQCTM